MAIKYNCKQLLDIVEILEQFDLDYWVDSGTLLGLVREGKLLAADKDIDIGIWSGDESKIISIFDSLLKDDFLLKKYYYNTELYKLKLIPTSNLTDRIVDINIFRKYKGSAWCFQSLFFEKKFLLFYYFMILIEYSFTVKYIKTLQKLFYGKYPLVLLRRPGFWQVPVEHFEKTVCISHKGKQIKVPNNCEKYLSLRYGNWKVPNRNWNFMTDDGLLKRKFPKILLEKL